MAFCLKFNRIIKTNKYRLTNSYLNCQQKALVNTESEKETPISFPEEEEIHNDIQQNKSKLLPQHRNMLHETMPYSEPHSWIHLTEKYQRNMFGRYGLKSGIDPRICFSTKQDLDLQEEYERVKYPHTLNEMIEINKNAKIEKRLAIEKRENEIASKLEKLEQWNAELRARIQKKEAEALAAKAKKERLVEEVRRHFGFKVDPRDDRFKEMLEQKEKEDRKKSKEAKRKAKEERMLEKLLKKNTVGEEMQTK